MNSRRPRRFVPSAACLETRFLAADVPIGPVSPGEIRRLPPPNPVPDAEWIPPKVGDDIDARIKALEPSWSQPIADFLGIVDEGFRLLVPGYGIGRAAGGMLTP